MGATTGIEWTDATWNPVRGCTRVSEGCRNCYAEIMAARFSKPGQWGHGFAAMKGGDHRWTGKVALIEPQLLFPLSLKTPRRIFVNSTSDLFHEALPDEAIDRVFAVMALCPQHIFQVLTKRPERMRVYFTAPHPAPNVKDWQARVCEQIDALFPERTDASRAARDRVVAGPIPNAWLGTSIEDQPTADARIPELLKTPAAIRFISAEPLLGPVDLRHIVAPEKVDGEDWRFDALTTGDIYYQRIEREFDAPLWESGDGPYREHALDWIICGSESGHHARECDLDWVRSLKNQCVASGVPFFWKQHAANGKKIPTPEMDGKRWVEFPEAQTP